VITTTQVIVLPDGLIAVEQVGWQLREMDAWPAQVSGR
jgi:hypothetical protein